MSLPLLPSCPFLPPSDGGLKAAAMKEMGKDRGIAFYERALECAQSLWRQGLPAQSILLMNRAFGSDLKGDEPFLEKWPLPYAAMKWVMENRKETQFIGNPRRHFQHLATRMVEPRKELRSWRAWACWWLAREVFPGCPADEVQLREEGIEEPDFSSIASNLYRWGWSGEVDQWLALATPPSQGS